MNFISELDEEGERGGVGGKIAPLATGGGGMRRGGKEGGDRGGLCDKGRVVFVT